MDTMLFNRNISSPPDSYAHAALLTLTFAVLLLMPEMAHAGANNIEKTLCNVIALVQGQTGKNIASLAIIIVGIGAMMGKISAGLCMIVCVGIAMIFGANTIVFQLTGLTPRCAAAVAPPDGLEQAICNVTLVLMGPTGKAFAMVAVIIMGIGGLMGKISWGSALAMVVGIACLFGSVSIVQALGGPVGGCTTWQAITPPSSLPTPPPIGATPAPGVPPIAPGTVPPLPTGTTNPPPPPTGGRGTSTGGGRTTVPPIEPGTVPPLPSTPPPPG